MEENDNKPKNSGEPDLPFEEFGPVNEPPKVPFEEFAPQSEHPQEFSELQPQPITEAAAEEPPLKKVNYFKRDLGLSSVTGGLTYSLAVLLYIGMSLLLAFIVNLANLDTSSDLFTYIGSLISPIAITITLAIIMCTRKVKFKEIFQPKAKPKYFLIAALMTLGLLFIGSLISGIFLKILELFGYYPDDSIMPDVTGVKIIPGIIFIALFPAFFEELLFRGIILHSAEKSMGSLRAILVTGFCFALMHGSPQQTVHQFMLGCMLGLLTVRSGSVLPAMLTHFLNNLIAVLLLAFSDSLGLEITAESASSVEMILGMAIYASIGVAIGMLVWLITDKRKPLIGGQNGGVKSFFTGASVGIAVMGLMWIIDLLSLL